MTYNVGMKIKELRKQKGLSQEELGNKIGVKKSAISKYERGEIQNLKRSTQEKLADVLGISPTNLFYDEPKLSLSNEEQHIIEAYRNADNLTKEMVKKVLDVRTDTERKIDDFVEEVCTLTKKETTL